VNSCKDRFSYQQVIHILLPLQAQVTKGLCLTNRASIIVDWINPGSWSFQVSTSCETGASMTRSGTSLPFLQRPTRLCLIKDTCFQSQAPKTNKKWNPLSSSLMMQYLIPKSLGEVNDVIDSAFKPINNPLALYNALPKSKDPSKNPSHPWQVH